MEGASATSPSRVHLAGCRPWTGERDKRVRLAAQPPRGRTWGPPGKKRGGEATSEVWGAFVIGPREGGMQAVHSYMGGGSLCLLFVCPGCGVGVSGVGVSGCQGGTRIIARPIIVSVRLCVAVVPVGGLRSTTPGFVFVSCPTVASSISGDRLRSVSSCASLLLRTCAHPACSPRPALTPAVAVLGASPVLSSFSTALTSLPLCSLPLRSHFLSSPPGSRLQSPISPASLSRGKVLLNWSNCCGFVHIKA